MSSTLERRVARLEIAENPTPGMRSEADWLAAVQQA